MRRVLHQGVVFALVLLAPGVATAHADGVYGRFDGDLVLSAEVMGAFADTPSGSGGALSVVARARYLDVTGAAIGYDRVFASGRRDALWAAIDFRPAWLARLNYDMQQGPRWVDLTVDSIGIELGGAWLRPGESFGAGGGLGFVLGGGVELPLVWSRGDAVMLRLGVRWITARPWDAQGTGARDGMFEAGIGVVFRTLVLTGTIPRYQ